jgi:ribosomal-protein-alanine N-acetyltransferase
MNFTKYTPFNTVGMIERDRIAQFLFEHLDEYGDKKEDIMRCVDYALENGSHPGGLILLAEEEDKIVGATIVNRTGMTGYIPDNILVYIAIHKDQRGKGVGKQLVQQAMDSTTGDIALHVESNNPAKHLYEKLGFSNKYLEMRWKRNG